MLREHRVHIAYDQTRIVYDLGGQPNSPPIILCDGVGCAGFIWKYLSRDLEGKYSLIHPNYRGHGRSHTPSDPEHVLIQDHCRDLLGILDQENIKRCFQNKYRAVFHFAALKAAGDSMDNPGPYSRINIAGSVNILNQMVDSEVQSFIFSSTASVYGEPEYLPIDESHPLKPLNYYGFTKLLIENLSKWYSELKGIRYAALRYFNAVGYDSNQRILGIEKQPVNLVPIIMEVASGKRDLLEVYGNNYDTPDGTGIRDYIHVSDLATAHYKAFKYIENKEKNLIVNLSTGSGHSVLEIINTTKEVTGKNIPYNITQKRKGDPAIVIADSIIADELLKWKCYHSDIGNSLKTTWEVYQKKYKD